MKLSKWFDPYFPEREGKPDRPQMADSWTTKKAGIYFIRHKATGATVYVGMSAGQLKKTIYRHFQEWNDRARKALWGDMKRKTYPKRGYQVRFIYTTPTQAARLEKYFIQKLNPKDNAEKYKAYFGKTEVEQERKTEPLEELERLIRRPDGKIVSYMPKADYLEEEYPF